MSSYRAARGHVTLPDSTIIRKHVEPTPAFTEATALFDRLLSNVELVVVGKHEQIRLVLSALLCRGHVLFEDVPGTAKTDVPIDQQTAWMVEGLRPCAEKAQSMGLTLLAENCDYGPIRPLMGRGSQCRDICARVASPAFRLIYDAGCALCGEEDTMDTLRTMAPFMVHVHLKNNKLMKPGETADRYNESISGARRYLGAALDGGELDLRPVFAQLDRLGYRGELLIEYQGMEDPRRVVPHNIEYLRKTVGRSATA